jgi:hypothetical protein
LDNASVVVNAQGISINNAFSVVVNGRRRGLMQSLVDSPVVPREIFDSRNFGENFDPPESTSEIFAQISTLAAPCPENFEPTTRPHTVARVNRTVGFVPTAFQNPPEDSRTLINSLFGGGAAEESIINAFSVVVSAKALAFSFNSTLLNSNNH